MLRRLSAPIFLAVLLSTSGCLHLMLSVPSAPQLSRGEVARGVVEASTEVGDRIPGYEAQAPGLEPFGSLLAASYSAPVQSVQSMPGLDPSDLGRRAPASPAATPIPRLSATLPILMYHYVNPYGARSADPYARDLTVSPALLESQLRHLSTAGFQSVSLGGLAAYLHGRGELPPRPVILAFDDGYQDNYTFAFPLLKRYGFKATFFMVTGLIGNERYLSWSQLLEMAEAGMEIGSHTVTHIDLLQAKPQEREQQLATSRRTLEWGLDRSVEVLAYPSGRYDRDVAAAAARAGYVAAVTTQYGVTHEASKLMELPRVRVRGEDPIAVFAAGLERFFPSGGPALR